MTTTGSRARQGRTLAAIQRFLASDLDALLDEHAATDPMPAMLELFRRTASGVPAYAALLRANGVDPASVRSAGVLNAPRSNGEPLAENASPAGPGPPRPRSSAVGRTPRLWKP